MVGLLNYVVLVPGTNLSGFLRTANEILASDAGTTGDESRVSLRAQPLVDIHLQSHLGDEIEPNSDIRYVHLMGTVGILILLIACINYTNLATARSLRRAREVGVRKAVGASRRQLAIQFLGESFFVVILALVLGLALVWSAGPLMEQWTGKPMLPTNFPGFVAFASVGLLLSVSLLAGSYPAVFLSRFRPADILAGGRGGAARRSLLRQSLVVAQFSASLVLIIGTLVVFRQLGFVRAAHLGFNKDQIVAVPVQDQRVRSSYVALADRLESEPGVMAVGATSSSFPGRRHSAGHSIQRTDIANAPALSVVRNWVDAAYLATMVVELLAGRSFSDDFASDEDAVVINETAARELGWEIPANAVGSEVVVNPATGPEERYVVGVARDFNFSSLHSRVEPLILTPNDRPTHLLIRLEGNDTAGALTSAQAVWRDFSSQPFTYFFIDREIDAFYRADRQWGKVLLVASALAVFVACLGLFGLAAFAAESRRREISIRKILGAAAAGVFGLLSRDFLKLGMLSLIFACPVAYFLMDRWLEDFAYRVDVGWLVFAVAGGAALLIAFATVAYQSLSAVLTDPVRALRT